MSNLKHYINELMHGNSFFSVKLIYKYTLLSVGVLQLVLSILFFVSASYLLMVIHLFSSAVLLSTNKAIIEREHLFSVYLLIILEVVFFTLMNTIFLGWECGFSSYLFSVVSSTFYFTFVDQNKNNTRNSLPLLLSLLVILCYFMAYALMQFISPIAPMPSKIWVYILFAFNTVVSFIVMIVFSYLFIWEILNKQRILTEQNEKLDILAHRDPLTKLLNRRSMNEIVNERMELLKKSGKRFTMILGDIDDFKKVNDTYGHDAGDLVLVTVAQTITDVVGENNYVCRWGGEEILILVSDPLEMASLTAEKIRKNIETNKVVFKDKEISITMTFGIAESIPGYKVEHLIQQADDKLYYGKRHGKNQVVTDLPPKEDKEDV